MVKRILVFLLIVSPAVLFSQAKDEKKSESLINTAIPIQAQYSKNFTINNVNFNKRIDVGGKGEVLEVEMNIVNKIDDPQELYVFVVASFENKHARTWSFNLPIPEKERVRSFIPYPFDLKNFEYPDLDKKGNVIKDKNGNEKMKLGKFPRNPKSGVDDITGKPYSLVKDKIIRTTHLSKYRTNYFFFNEVAIIIFDNEGKPAYRQLYELKGKRR